MDEADRTGGFAAWRVTRYYAPLFFQAFSQCLTYPLVASIVTLGPLGVDELTAFAQGQTVMFLVGALGGGLITTGMVFGRTAEGFAAFRRLNFACTAVLAAIQALLAIPAISNWIFGALLNMEGTCGPERADIMIGRARETLFWGVFMQIAFFFRNVPLVALFNARESGKANAATFIRIILTLAAAPVFRAAGLSGHLWGLAATTAACWVETWLTWLFARKFVDSLPAERGPSAGDSSAARQFRFAVPLSFGGLLLALSPLVAAFFISRSADGRTALNVHYLTVGLANAVGFGSLRMQQVAIQFPPERPRDFRLPLYSLCAGLCLAVLPLSFAISDSAARFYFSEFQNLAPEHLPKARTVMGLYALLPAAQALRGCVEGFAAVRKRSKLVFAGQIAYFGTLAALLAAFLAAGAPGWIMGVAAILAAPSAACLTVSAGLRREPPPPASAA